MDNFIYVALVNSLFNNLDWDPLLNTILVKRKKDTLIPYDFDKSAFVLDYKDSLSSRKTKFYQPYRSGFKAERFAHNQAFRGLLKNKFKSILINPKDIRNIFLKYSSLIISKKDKVFKVLEGKRELLIQKDYELMKKRVSYFLKELEKATTNPDFKFYGRERLHLSSKIKRSGS